MPRQPFSVSLIKKTFKTRFALARATTKHALFKKIVNRVAFKGDQIYYLPRDKTIAIEQDAGTLPGSMAVPSRVLDHFIDQASVHVVMNKCICRDAARCKDYPVDLGCLFLGEAAARISPALSHRVTREEAKAHEQACRDAGLVHLIGRNKLDTVWLNVRPGEKLLTICNCDPCCCLWKMLPDLSPDIARNITRMPGVTVEITDACTGCGTCMTGTCFVDAIHLDGNRAMIDQVNCRGCGRCAERCPSHAIVVNIKDTRFITATIDAVERLVDVK
ncbi:MAG: 4Fe-4S binding protein [Candidatus Lokiarchaeota archaeon]|nr:4Fe-4S binding protein [Candidatus Lokiarchaeota archaeon]